MAEDYPIRPITTDELDSFRDVQQHAFNSGHRYAARVERVRRMFEADRSLAAFDPALGRPAGVTGIYSLRMAVPGAVLPVAGVSMVAVLPTHRRRGILRALMHRQLADIAARGEEPVAALWASESAIYPHYGYGRATSKAHFEFHRGEATLSPAAPADPALRLRLAAPRAVLGELAKVYDSVQPGQPGFFARDDDWWGRLLHDDSEGEPGAFPARCLLAEDAAGVRGYAVYTARERWDDAADLPDCAIEIRELLAADPAAGAALWHNLLDRDLVTVVTADLRPADDPVLYQLADGRRARPQVSDGLWVRIVDLAAALRRRAYAGPVDVVLDVTDPLLAANTGRWRLRADGPPAPAGQAVCERTSDPADITLDVRELGAAYLGGTRLGTLAAAGLLTEHRPGAVARLSAAMTWDPAPWCAQIF